jgi:hypothetical protein
VRVGQFVVIQGEKHEFFSMVTDIALAATNRSVLASPPDGDDFFHEVLAGTATYGALQLIPMLMLPHDTNQWLRPVKTVPTPFCTVLER